MQDLDSMHPKYSMCNSDDSWILISDSKIENFELSPPTKRGQLRSLNISVDLKNVHQADLQLLPQLYSCWRTSLSNTNREGQGERYVNYFIFGRFERTAISGLCRVEDLKLKFGLVSGQVWSACGFTPCSIAPRTFANGSVEDTLPCGFDMMSSKWWPIHK